MKGIRTPLSWVGVAMLSFGMGALCADKPGATSEEFRRMSAQNAIIQLGDRIGETDVAERAKQIVKEYDSEDISSVFKHKPAGGLGVGKLKETGFTRDSIQHLMSSLARRKNITEAEIERYFEDYQRTAKVLQAMAELAPYRASERVKKNDKLLHEWEEVAKEFKEGATSFRRAVDGKDPKSVRLAALRMQDTCCHCHELAF